MAKVGPTPVVEGANQPELGPDLGPTQAAKARALELAKVQATDEEIEAVLRCEFAACRPARIQASELRKRLRDWAAALQDARVAGRLLPLEALRRAAEGGDVAAATALHRRQELLDGLDPVLLREVKRLVALEPDALKGELERLGQRLKVA